MVILPSWEIAESSSDDLLPQSQSSLEGAQEIAQIPVDTFNALERLPVVSIAVIEEFASGGPFLTVVDKVADPSGDSTRVRKSRVHTVSDLASITWRSF